MTLPEYTEDRDVSQARKGSKPVPKGTPSPEIRHKIEMSCAAKGPKPMTVCGAFVPRSRFTWKTSMHWGSVTCPDCLKDQSNTGE